MVERNGPPLGGGLCNKPSEPLCCISVNRIFDSVRDKDCLEDLRVFLSAAVLSFRRLNCQLRSLIT